MRFTPYTMIILLSLLVLAPATHGQVTMTLEECLVQAVERSPQLESSRAKMASSRASALMTGAERLPTLYAAGSASYISETMQLEFPVSPLFPTGYSVDFGDGKNYDTKLAVRAPLYTGGALSNRIKALGKEANASELDFSADSLKVLHLTRTAYYKSLSAAEAERAVRTALDRLKRHEKELEGSIEIGMAGEEERLSLLSRIREVEQQVASASSAAAAARLQLGQIVGKPGEEVFPNGGLETVPGVSFSETENLLKERPDVMAWETRRESAKNRTDALKGQWWPTVSAEAAYHYGKPGIDNITNDWMGYATVGVNLNWTIFDWKTRGYSIEGAKADERKIASAQRATLETWKTQVQSAQKFMDAAETRLKIAEDRLGLERRRYELIQGRYQQGQASENELLDAEDDLTSAEISLVQATADLRLTEADLFYTLGR